MCSFSNNIVKPNGKKLKEFKSKISQVLLELNITPDKELEVGDCWRTTKIFVPVL